MIAFAKRLPPILQKPFRSFYGLLPPHFRLGQSFRETTELLRESQWWSKGALEEYQNQQLQRLLRHAYDNVPYYTRLFNERRLKPKDITSTKDLRKLPCLTKEIVREHFVELISRNIPKSQMQLARTSGTTADPLSFYREKKRTDSLEVGFVEALWNRVGFQTWYHRRVDFPPEKAFKPGSWFEYDSVNRILNLSPYHMTEKNLFEYVNKIEGFTPSAIMANPSTGIILADFMQRHNIRPFSTVKTILLGSEMLYPWQRDKLSEAFDCRIFSCYGQAERVVFAGECELSTKYHVFPEYGVTELLDRRGEPIEEAGEKGAITGTAFNNYAMPLIRYRMGDIAVWSDKKCGCGRNYPLFEKIEGREQEFVVSKDGTLVPLLTIPYTTILKDKNVEQFQFHQDIPGKLILKLVTMADYGPNDTASILDQLGGFLKRMQCEIQCDIQLVNHIPKTERGKYLYMIQKIPIKFGT